MKNDQCTRFNRLSAFFRGGAAGPEAEVVEGPLEGLHAVFAAIY
jgi:hypothetical protein